MSPNNFVLIIAPRFVERAGLLEHPRVGRVEVDQRGPLFTCIIAFIKNAA